MFSNLRSTISRWRRIRRAEYELSQLDDRELNDLGISRSDIPRIARHGVKV
jgi:uncharacterized protein YjiS (DUF1127 family)